LTSTYLGLNGLFSNVLSFLSLAELGVGVAINYALYKPIAEGDTELVKSIMWLYRKLYRYIGCIVLAAGGALAPFLPYLIQDMPKDMPNIYLYYLLYVLNSGVSYFYTYKRSIIICSQKEYISTVTTTISEIILFILQIIVLAVSHSYGAYLAVAVIVTVAENLSISAIADYMYPYLKDKPVQALPKEVSADIKKNVFALMFHKIGSVIVFSTDNLIISRFVGLVAVGLYSNYTLIINALNLLLTKIFSSITASVGNLLLSNNKKHVEDVFYRVLFVNFWMRGFCAVALFCLFQPFILLWIGGDYLLSFSTVLIIVLNFYIGGMRSTVGLFRDASGIFWYDRYKPLIESALNIILSIPLAIHYGVAGVLLGTIGSTILVPFWFEAYVLFKYYFNKGIIEYLLRQLLYGVIAVLTGAGCFLLCTCADGYGLAAFAIRSIICAIVPNIIFSVIFCRTAEFKYFWNFIKNILKKGNRL